MVAAKYHSRLDLVCSLFLVWQPFETVFRSISGRLPKREKEKREDRGPFIGS